MNQQDIRLWKRDDVGNNGMESTHSCLMKKRMVFEVRELLLGMIAGNSLSRIEAEASLWERLELAFLSRKH